MSQPLEVYPTPFPPPVAQSMPATSHHSGNGSFGSVFIVLAVIVVISAIACFLGRLCNRRHKDKHGHNPKSKHSQAAASRSKEKEPNKHNRASQPREGDIEFGFDKRFSSAKVAANEEFGGGSKGFHQGGPARGEGDIEFGFDKRFPSGRGGGPGGNEEFRGHKPLHNGKSRREMRFADDGELKPGA